MGSNPTLSAILQANEYSLIHDPLGESERLFTSGKAKPQTARANWSRYLDTVFELAKVKDAHSHWFRDTFAVSLLEKGVSIEKRVGAPRTLIRSDYGAALQTVGEDAAEEARRRSAEGVGLK